MHTLIKRNPLPVIILTVFIDLLGFGILIPVIPLLLADPISKFYILTKNISPATGYILLGFLTATYPLAQFLAAPILGQLSDVHGRKKILFLSIMGTSISYFIFALGIVLKNIPLLFLSRALDGITGGNISVAQASIADITKPQDRAKNFGLIGASFGLGFIFGPYLGGALSDPHTLWFFNATTPFLFAGLLSLINLISIYFFFPETNLNRVNKIIKFDRAILNIKKAINLIDLRIIFLTNFLFASGFTFFTTFFSVYLINKFRFDQGDIGNFFAYLGMWGIITQGLIARKLAGKFREDQIIKITLIGISLATISYYLPNAWWQLLFIVPFFSAFNGLSNVNLTGLLSRSADPNNQGEVLGLNSSVVALAQVLPPILSGFIAARINPTAPIIVSAIVLGLAAGVFNFKYKIRITNCELKQ